MSSRLHGCLAVCLLALALPAASGREKPKKPIEDPAKGVNFFSLEREMAWGKMMAGDVERDARMVRDPVVSEYVNRLAQNLVRNSDAKVPFTVKVIDAEEVNAFALPGGFLFVNTGLVLQAHDESELAGVIAHEIAHVTARHGTKQATRGQIVNYASLPLIFMGGWPGYAVRQVAQIAIPMGFLKFSRNMETQADALGLQYLHRSGYDPVSFVDFFERVQTLEKSRPSMVSRAFSSHPMTKDRIRKAQLEIQSRLTPKETYVVDTSEFQDVKQRLQSTLDRHRLTADPNLPALRRRPAARVDREEPASDQDERPTIKRRN